MLAQAQSRSGSETESDLDRVDIVRLLGRGSDQQSQWRKWAQRHVFEGCEVPLDQRERIQNRFRFVNSRAVHQEDHALAVPAGVPLPDLAVEVKLHRLPNLPVPE